MDKQFAEDTFAPDERKIKEILVIPFADKLNDNNKCVVFRITENRFVQVWYLLPGNLHQT